MATCQFCVPWNAPLSMRPKRMVDGAHMGLTFDGWLWWYLHVCVHQVPSQWGGEIEQYIADLKTNDAGPLDISTQGPPS